MKLVYALGIPLHEIRRWPTEEIYMHLAYWQLQGIQGAERLDFLVAVNTLVTARCAGNKDAKLEHYIPSPPKEQQSLTVDQLAAHLTALNNRR